MPATFATYTEASLNAYKFNPKSQEVLERKREILTSIAQHHGSSPASVLFYGFSPLMLISTAKMIAVTDITDEIKKLLDSTGIKYVYIKETDLKDYKKQFDWVAATDEYFTFAVTEQAQLDKVQTVAELAKNVIVTTLRDYKNQDFRDREFSQPLAVRNGRDSKIFLEYHDYDYNDKNAWKTTVHEMASNDSKVTGPFARRSMYFKQMAKFSIDAGAKEFYVHKKFNVQKSHKKEL